MSNVDSSSPGTQVWHLNLNKRETYVEKISKTWNEIKRNVYTKDEQSSTRKLIKSTPTMVFSVIGDSDSCVPSPWPTSVFQTALIEAAKSGGETFILFKGNGGGVSNVVRDAYQHYEDMEFGSETRTVNDPERHIKLISMTGKKTDKQQSERNMATIHTCEIEEGDDFMLDFEQFVSEQEIFYFGTDMEFKIPVPIVILVCEGDIDTISHISKALQGKIPVIIMKGSGNAADLVLDYIDDPDILRKNVSIILNIELDDPKFSNLENNLQTIRDNWDLVGVFDLDRDDPHVLSGIAGKAIVSCWSVKRSSRYSNPDVQEKEKQTAGTNKHMSQSASKSFSMDLIDHDQLVKGLKWGSRPYVQSPNFCTSTSLPLYFYFGYQILQAKPLMKECGDVLLLEALKANRCDYVRVLLDRGVKFNIDNLSELYEQTISCQDCKFKEQDCLHFKWILYQIPTAKTLCLQLLQTGKIKERNITMNGKTTKKNTKHVSVISATKKLCCEILGYEEYMQGETFTDESIADVLLWSIFVNRKELAEICWLRGKDQLLTGLVCSAILKELSNNASNVKEQVLSKDLEDHSKIFQGRCLSIMDRMYEENTKQAIDLMDTQTVVWGIHSSPLTFAYENFMYDVVAHTCSQKYMNKQWYNRLSPKIVPFLKSALSKPRKFIFAPRTKYLLNYVIFFFVLAMYSDFVLTSIGDPFYDTIKAHVFEYSMYVWAVGDFIEELIACFGCKNTPGRSHRGYWSRVLRHLNDFWNVVDLLSFLLLTIALCVRHAYPVPPTFTFARNMFALSLLVMYLRILEVFLIHRIMGPTIIMIKEMLKDLLRFLFIAVVVVLGVGIYYHANMWPDHQSIWSDDWNNWRIWSIIYFPYWQLYAELNLETLDGSEPANCTKNRTIWENDPSKTGCSQDDWTVKAIAGIYVLFSNLLLVNLVIAMFSYTFERVQENSEKLWHFQRYTVICDYNRRIPSPFNLIPRLVQLIFLLKRDRSCDIKIGHTEIDLMNTKEKRKKSALQKNFQKIISFRSYNTK